MPYSEMIIEIGGVADDSRCCFTLRVKFLASKVGFKPQGIALKLKKWILGMPV